MIAYRIVTLKALRKRACARCPLCLGSREGAPEAPLGGGLQADGTTVPQGMVAGGERDSDEGLFTTASRLGRVRR